MSRATSRAPLIAWLRANAPAGIARSRVERKVLAAPTYARAKTIAETAAEMSPPGVTGDDGSPAGVAPPDVAGEIKMAIEAIRAGDVNGGIETLESLLVALPEREADDNEQDGDAIPTADAMTKEGLPAKLAGEIAEQARKHPALARSSLQHARARLNPNASPYMPRTPSGGAGRVA